MEFGQRRLHGFEGKCNTCLFRFATQASSDKCEAPPLGIIFLGDISNFHANLPPEYQEHSYEEIFWMFSAKFPRSDLVLMEPHSRNKLVSIYNNFLPSDCVGIPLWSLLALPEEKNPKSDVHLYFLLDDLKKSFEIPYEWSTIDLYGFSKGSVVFTGLVLSTLEDFPDPVINNERLRMWQKIRNIHFLDPGLETPHQLLTPLISCIRELPNQFLKPLFTRITLYFHQQLADMQSEVQDFSEFWETHVGSCRLYSYPSTGEFLKDHFEVLKAFLVD